MHTYRGFGLRILSEIEFPELIISSFDTADVTIVLGSTPEQLTGEGTIHKAYSSSNDHEFLFKVKNICTYYAAHGSNIVVSPAPGIDMHSVRLFLLGTVIAAILYQRGSIPLHASAIVKNGELTLFTGHSGAGKSTLLACLAIRGHQVFTDDICVLHPATPPSTIPSGTASYPMIKLWEDSLNQLESDSYSRDFKIRPELPKYGQFFHDTFLQQTLPIKQLFILSPSIKATQISITSMPSIAAFAELEKQAYRPRLITGTNLRGLHFALLLQLTKLNNVYEVVRPTSGTNIQQLAESIETYL